METPIIVVETLFEQAEAYGKKTIEITRLKAVESAASLAPYLVANMAVIAMLTLSLLALTIGVAFWLGALLGNTYYGFFAVAAFYLIAGIIMHFFLHGWIKSSLGNYVIKKALH
jgi:hypothetical protein